MRKVFVCQVLSGVNFNRQILNQGQGVEGEF